MTLPAQGEVLRCCASSPLPRIPYRVATANRRYEATTGFTFVANCVFASALLSLSKGRLYRICRVFLENIRCRMPATPSYTANRQFPWTVLLNGQDEKEHDE